MMNEYQKKYYEDKTQLIVLPETKQKLKDCGCKGESYDKILRRLVEMAMERMKEREVKKDG